jgi:hypothetical protein
MFNPIDSTINQCKIRFSYVALMGTAALLEESRRGYSGIIWQLNML